MNRSRNSKVMRFLSFASLAICLFTLAACADTFTFVKRSTDQKALATLAQNDADPYVRREAVKKINDPKVLEKIAQTDADTVVRQEAVNRITDEKILEKIAETNDRPYIQQEAVKKITDEAVLISIALNFPYTLAGHEAVKRISDQTVLAQIALKASSNQSRESVYFRSRAVRRLKDPEVLKQIAQNDVDPNVRRLAQDTLADLETLARAAKWVVEESGVEQNALAQIAQSDPDEKVRYLAVEKLNDQKDLSRLSQLSQVGPNSTAGALSESILPEQEVLGQIAQQDPDVKVRYLAVNQLNDQNMLIKIAQNEPDEKIRYTAVNKLTDPNVLSQIAQNDPEEKIRYLAAHNLLERDGTVATSETTPIKLILLDPEIVEYWGDLQFYCREFWTVQEYSNNATFNRRHLEIKIIGKNNKIIFHKFYGTRSGAIVESFVRLGPGQTAPAGGGLADIDYAEICAALLKPMGVSNLKKIIVKSKNMHLLETALLMTSK
ncbi:MAG: HEAT repeat domain-containing protein [Deltaproteobacteria bacterium]|nr:HEAT repeat domain-containing protein [Deltaproteobacteria bacterium]